MARRRVRHTRADTETNTQRGNGNEMPHLNTEQKDDLTNTRRKRALTRRAPRTLFIAAAKNTMHSNERSGADSVRESMRSMSDQDEWSLSSSSSSLGDGFHDDQAAATNNNDQEQNERYELDWYFLDKQGRLNIIRYVLLFRMCFVMIFFSAAVCSV